nr:hypothetical protein [Halolamina pelagica]
MEFSAAGWEGESAIAVLERDIELIGVHASFIGKAQALQACVDLRADLLSGG